MVDLAAGARRVGFLADTHSRKNDGSDLPDRVLGAFADADVDLVVHLGDIGKRAILDRLATVAPVAVPFGANKGYLLHGTEDPPVRVLATANARVGLWFDLAQPDKKIVVTERAIDFGDHPLDRLLARRFGGAVDVVAFGGTHCPLEQRHGGVLFFNPGSPTLPAGGSRPSVAVLDLTTAPSTVAFVPVA